MVWPHTMHRPPRPGGRPVHPSAVDAFRGDGYARGMRRLAFAILLLLTPALFADTPDEAKIRRAALDYAESWYAGDAEQMRRALHPELAKRIAKNGVLENMTADRLIAGVGAGHGKKTPPERQLKEVKILDVFGNTASVRLEMSGWIDYMHLVKLGDDWKIVNVLWEMKPR